MFTFSLVLIALDVGRKAGWIGMKKGWPGILSFIGSFFGFLDQFLNELRGSDPPEMICKMLYVFAYM